MRTRGREGSRGWREEMGRVELARSWSVTARREGVGEHGVGGGVSRLFRAGTKDSRMTNAKRARGQPDLCEQRTSQHGDKKGCWESTLSYKENCS
ncbi:unnamed protein product [Lasius platythorax]|uniref:Uncharacterized protein n=1 Tax=Lasius platythorax TaxID=488582 RepID=A0AAV2P2H9_9HYME